MKKYIYSLMACTSMTLCLAQSSVTQAEYFWDTDPGVGLATAVQAADGNFNRAFEQLSVTASMPSVGLHKFGIRVTHNTGQWGPVFMNIVNVQAATTSPIMSVLQAEYFWDTDPGVGLGTPVLATDGNFNSAFEQLTRTGIALPAVGLHVFNIRVKDNTGQWGPVFRNVVSVQTSLGIDTNDLSGFIISPNPATTVVHFNKDFAKVDIVDFNGRLVGTAVSNNEINIEGLSHGTYILRITTPEGLTFNKKMIKR